MWHTLRVAARVDRDTTSATIELLQSTSRHIVAIIGGACLVCSMVAPLIWKDKLIPVTLLFMPVVALTCSLTLWFLLKRFVVAQVIWQAGLTAAIVIAINTFQQPLIGLSYALLPLMAVVAVGWPAGLAAEALVIAVVWWLAHGLSVPPLPLSHGMAIIAGGAITGLVGWASTRALLTVTEWSLFSSEQARRKKEEADEHRMELQQIQEDLLRANRELARLSDRLKAINQVAEEARRAKEEFVANVSHELRTPLNIIIGFSQMITQSPQVYGTRLPAALLADIAAIQRNSQHLAKLVDDVLDLSQIDAGRMALSKEWTSLQDIIQAAILVVQPLFDAKGLYLETEIADALPAVFVDSTRIRQVVVNLLSNAGRFTEQGGVRVRAWREAEEVFVSVTDTGPGIPLENQSKLFEPFQQLDGSIRRRHGGSGLGLSIAKRFVEMHGGKIWLDSTSGVGTTFYFSLPIEVRSPVSLATYEAKRWFNPYGAQEARLRRPRATAPAAVPRYLVLEEGDTLHRLLSRYLADAEIVSVSDMAEVAHELRRSPARALIANIPPVDRSSFLQNDLPQDLPTVMCWVPGAHEAARQLGVVRYLVKPVTRETLLSTLESLDGTVRRILLVDDQPEALQLFSRLFASADRRYELLLASNGQRALDLMRERQPDVVLIDLIMPGMDGFQLLQQKNQDNALRHIPAIVISSRDPIGEAVISDGVVVARAGRLSARDLLACIQSVSQVLSPAVQPVDRDWPEKLAE